jgi:NADH:ubiquinone oxidoreductase subunit H
VICFVVSLVAEIAWELGSYYGFLVVLSLLYFLVMVVCVLLAVAFFTLFERRGLGYIQIRRGPVKVGYIGILQPFADAIKLLIKEFEQPIRRNFFPYFVCPVLSLFLFLAIWVVVPFVCGGGQVALSLLFFLCVVGVGVYSVMGSG